MKKSFVLTLCLIISAGHSLLYADGYSGRKEEIQFFGLTFSNLTSVNSGATDNDQLFGAHLSTLRLRSRGGSYSEFGFLYNYSARDTDGVIGIPFPANEKVQDLESDTISFPSRRGYVFRLVREESFEFHLIPSLGASFFWTDIDYNTDESVEPDIKKTRYEGYMVGIDFRLGFDIAMMHRFDNVYVRYGIELDFPLMQFSASRMKKEESKDGIYYADPLRAYSNDFISVADVFKLGTTPYVAIGFRFNDSRWDIFDDVQDASFAKR